MRYLVKEPIRIRKQGKEMELESDRIVALHSHRAEGLVRAGKLIPLIQLFEELYHQHIQRLKQYNVMADEIRERLPKHWQTIQGGIRAMDTAFLSEDLQTFKEAMAIVEQKYYESVSLLRGEDF